MVPGCSPPRTGSPFARLSRCARALAAGWRASWWACPRFPRRANRWMESARLLFSRHLRFDAVASWFHPAGFADTDLNGQSLAHERVVKAALVEALAAVALVVRYAARHFTRA